jgi:hypothetical protein
MFNLAVIMAVTQPFLKSGVKLLAIQPKPKNRPDAVESYPQALAL